MTKQSLICISALLLLTACDDLSIPKWMGGGEEKKLAGDRIAIMEQDGGITSDEDFDITVELPEPITNSEWSQAGGRMTGTLGHVSFGGGFSIQDDVRVGDGNDWEQTRLPISPVVAQGMVFAMDAKGVVSAHDTHKISKVRWMSEAAVDPDGNDILGGGLAYAGGMLFVATGIGEVVALDAATGNERWRKSLELPIRAAPRAAGSMVFVITVDNQLTALSAADGRIAWTQRGITETAGFLSTIVPAVGGDVVIAAYSSGEIHALRRDSGEEQWADSLSQATRTSATGNFTGIDASPVIAGDKLFAVSSSGMLAASDLTTGRRIWERDIASRNAPWIAGDFLYVLTTSNQLLGVYAPDGRVKWATQLARYGDAESRKKPISWSGPVLAGGRLLLVNDKETLLSILPQNGKIDASYDIPEGVFTAPVVADNMLYLIDSNAHLSALQ